MHLGRAAKTTANYNSIGKLSIKNMNFDQMHLVHPAAGSSAIYDIVNDQLKNNRDFLGDSSMLSMSKTPSDATQL